MRKYIPHAVAGLLAVTVVFLFFAVMDLKNSLADANNVINAQQIQLAGGKDELQKANSKLGLAESTVVSKNALLAKYKKDIDDLNIEIVSLKSGKKPTPRSLDSGKVVIGGSANGKGSIKEQPVDSKPPDSDGANAESPIVTAVKIGYDWRDDAGRFHLEDPDIYVPGDESFSYKLKVRINGYILEDPTGRIRGRQVVARELIETKNPDGTVSVKEGEPLQIEDNIYQYSLPIPEKKLSDIIKLRGYALFDTSLNPGIGLEMANLGHYIDYVNIGIGPFISFDSSNLPRSLQSSLLGLGVHYTLIPPAISTNIGIGLGISTPADDLFGRFQVTGNIIFYLTN